MRKFLITGSTDGLGLQTAKQLAKTAPAVSSPSDRRVIALHGRNRQKIMNCMAHIKDHASDNSKNFILQFFNYDLSHINAVKDFADEVAEHFDEDDPLDCLVNNAAIIDMYGPNTCQNEHVQFELSFMVNTVAPFVLTKKLLEGKPGTIPKRVCNSNTEIHRYPRIHAKKLDYESLQWEKGGWAPKRAYALNKLCFILMSRGWYHAGDLPAQTTMIDFHPGVVNTKQLLSAFGDVGMDIEQTDSTFLLATDEKYDNPGQLPKYYIETKEADPVKQAMDPAACLKFYEYMQEITKDYFK